MITLWTTLALADAPPTAPEDVPPPRGVAIRAYRDGEPDAKGVNLLVQVETPAAITPQLAVPEIPDVTFSLVGEPTSEVVGDHRITTARLRADTPTGRFALGPFLASGTTEDGPFSAPSGVVYVDVGVDPLQIGDIADIAEPAAVWTVPVGPILAGVGVVGLVVAGLAVALRRARPTPLAEVAAEPPDIVALRAWKAVRHDPALDDFQKALALSRIFRDYAEAALNFPASKWTTSETLDYLGALPHLEEGNLPRARRLLRATDRVKYAEEAPGTDLFEDLDADLRAFVSSTRPVRLTA